MKRFAAAAWMAMATTACRVAPPLRVASEATWTEVSPETAVGTADVPVSPGDVVRIESDASLRVGEILRESEGTAVVWRTIAPLDHAVYLRAGLFTTAVRVPGPSSRTLHVGSPRRPELAWFELESRALEWARAPLGTPFPELAAAPRFDRAQLSALDASLTRTEHAPLVAIRSLVALRAVRTLEGLRAFPFAVNGAIELRPEESPRTIDGRDYVAIDRDHPVSFEIDGPRMVFVWARAAQTDADAVVEVRVTEGGRRRARTSGAATKRAPDGSLLRRMLVHAPPGHHTYAIETAVGAAYVAAEDSKPVVRLEDALTGKKSEQALLADAKRACDAPSPAAACALALALAGEDGSNQWSRAMAASAPAARRIADALAGGGPDDVAAVLEGAPVGEAALAELGRVAADSLDTSYRDGWLRATLRETSWEPARTEGPTWAILSSPASASASGCAAARDAKTAPANAASEIGASLVEVPASRWRRAQAVHFRVTAPCEANAEPIRLEVDGETLVAQPSSERTTWRVVVRGSVAKVRRLDRGRGRVVTLGGTEDCRPERASVGAPTPLGSPRSFDFPASATAPGLEVWLRDDDAKRGAEITVRGRNDRIEIARVEVRAAIGLTATDPQGTVWRRVARVPLPTSAAASGVTVEGAGTVAVRAVVRAKKRTDLSAAGEPDIEHARPADLEALTTLSRRMLSLPPTERGALYLERALLLASFGAERAALGDGETAKRLGARGPQGEDAVSLVRSAILSPAPAPLELALAAYGLEPDFDASAKRCLPSDDGARGALSRLEVELSRRPAGAKFDRALAVRAQQAIEAAPNDPRRDTLLHLVMSGSRWKVKSDGTGERVVRPSSGERSGVLDVEGRLRTQIAAGNPFDAAFAVVTPERPARASLAHLGAANARLDAVCIDRHPQLPSAGQGTRCSLSYRIGESEAQNIPIGDDGRGRVDLPHPAGRGKGAELAIAVAPASGDPVALVRVVLDRSVHGATNVPGVGWVLEPPRVQHRYLVTAGRPFTVAAVAAGGPTLLRFDARAEPGGGELSVVANGREVPLPSDGTPRVVALADGGPVVVAARAGRATVAVAERVELEGALADDGALPAPKRSGRHVASSSARVDLSDGAWKDVVLSSPPPLGWLGERLGTIEASGGATVTTLRDGTTADNSEDAYAFTRLTYRRRVEGPNLYALAGVEARFRPSANTYGARVNLYEDVDALRLRVTGGASGFTQEIAGQQEAMLKPHGFVEYSGRMARDFFVLPRLGYDGSYTTLDRAPKTTRDVDSDVFDAFRLRRKTFLFAQALLWWVPHFNDIFFLRLRGTYDATRGQFSHAAVRSGTFLIFGPAEVGAFADAQFYAATPGARAKSSVDVVGGGALIWHGMVVPGSFEVRPIALGAYRVSDGGWQVTGGVSIIGSRRRGMRDFSSLELEFPEETSGAIPWRGDKKVGP